MVFGYLKLYWASVIFLFAGLILMVHFNSASRVFNYDSFGYHNYLPSAFIYNDIGEYGHLDSIIPIYRPTGEKMIRYGIHQCENTGKSCNKYPMGVAIMQAPLFLVAHLATSNSDSYPSDGYSQPYQWANRLSTLLSVFFGLMILTHFLSKFFNSFITSITILCVGFGTNLFNYSVVDVGLSHAYLFLLYSLFLIIAYRWYQCASLYLSLALGFVAGIIAITRPVDVIVVLIPIIWAFISRESRTFVKRNISLVIISVLMFVFTLIPQMLYWRFTSGDWVYFSYPSNEFFNWSSPRIVDGLLSYRKGWLVYSPLAILMLTGLITMKSQRFLVGFKTSLIVFLILYVYIVFSWNNWFYGWSFGSRPMVQVYALLAFPMAWTIRLAVTAGGIRKFCFLGVIVILVFFNLFQNWQYKQFIIVGDTMNKELYWNNFLRTSAHPANSRIIREQKKLDQEIGW